MRVLTILFFIILIGLLFYFSLKGTVFEISLKKRRYGGLLIGRELFILVLLGVLVLEFLGPSQLNTFYISDLSIQQTTPAVLITVAILVASIGFFSKTLFKKNLLIKSFENLSVRSDITNNILLLHSTAILMFILILAVHASGANHAFISNLMSGADLLQVRMANRYEFAGPSFLMGYMRFTTILLALLLGFFGSKIKKSKEYLYLSLVFYAASLPGDKAPVVGALILYYLGKISIGNYRSKKLFFIGLLVFLVILSLIYFLVKIQFPEMNFKELIFYIFERVGFMQIQGVYEQFALRLHDISYIVSEIPFSGLFFEYTPFPKDLMMRTAAYNVYYKDVGVMNSLFIGEALAIGGEILVYISPIVVAFNYCLVVYMAVKFLMVYIKVSSLNAKKIGTLFVTAIAPFTGDLGGLLFFKRLIAVAIFFVLLYLVYISVRIIRRHLLSRPLEAYQI